MLILGAEGMFFSLSSNNEYIIFGMVTVCILALDLCEYNFSGIFFRRSGVYRMLKRTNIF